MQVNWDYVTLILTGFIMLVVMYLVYSFFAFLAEFVLNLHKYYSLKVKHFEKEQKQTIVNKSNMSYKELKDLNNVISAILQFSDKRYYVTKVEADLKSNNEVFISITLKDNHDRNR
ncbi:hypothetical protein LS73_008215 [Helicobacter muridarum]|uniref:Uncharacterized protein n=1 Tax=Helicobacter muridarum TaxID=216 RepID=A0A099U136_9HELI|nr:hypothetical protein [Helicobacter muridarum]TLD98800.1 hypothetical protein LS73_008215 [Helicobacter muridarum]STQ85777.1 Uncharacterised protein [Helicobacter muridarum]